MSDIEKHAIRIDMLTSGKSGYISKQTDIDNLTIQNLYVVDINNIAHEEAKQYIVGFYSKRKALEILKKVNNAALDANITTDMMKTDVETLLLPY